MTNEFTNEWNEYRIMYIDYKEQKPRWRVLGRDWRTRLLTDAEAVEQANRFIEEEKKTNAIRKHNREYKIVSRTVKVTEWEDCEG